MLHFVVVVVLLLFLGFFFLFFALFLLLLFLIHDFITLVTVSGTCLSNIPSSVTGGPTVTRCFFGVGPRVN